MQGKGGNFNGYFSSLCIVMPLSVSRYLIKLVNIEVANVAIVANVANVANEIFYIRGLITDERSRSAT